MKNIPYLICLKIALCLAHAGAAPLSDRLEQAIYQQETVRNLDAAIVELRGILQETDANAALAAEARCRLGFCLVQKGEMDAATEAFEAVVRDFPGDSPWKAAAQAQLLTLTALEPAPWPDGERLLALLKLANGNFAGLVEYRADQGVTADGQTVWRVGGRLSAGAESYSEVEVEAENFTPIRSHWKMTQFGTVDVEYQPKKLIVQREGKADAEIDVQGLIYDNEQAVHLLRRLPLKVGYTKTLMVYASITSASIPFEITVEREESVTVPAGTFQCFRVKTNIGQTLWFSADKHRYPVKFETGGVSGELAAVSVLRAGNLAFQDTQLGVSMSAPSGWILHRWGNQPAGQALIRTYDPKAETRDGGVRLFPTDKMPEAIRQSSQVWAEKEFQDLKIKPDVKVLEMPKPAGLISGRPAWSFAVELPQNNETLIRYSIFAIGSDYSEHFVLLCEPQAFKTLRPVFDTMVASYRRR